MNTQLYTKYIHEAVCGMDLNTATYKDLHRVFEWYGCIQLSKESGHAVTRWEDIPADLREERDMPRDMGIDAWDMEGNRVIQMKLYHGRIEWAKFATFWAGCDTSFEECERILYRTSCSTLHRLISKNIHRGKLQDMTVTDGMFRAECMRIQALTIQLPLAQEVEEVRPYQVEAKKMIERAKTEQKNVCIALPTGTGKTAITLAYHKQHVEECILVLVPTLVLMEQWFDACMKRGITAYRIGTARHHSLKEHATESVIVCVYDSFINIREEVGRFDRIVVDEAHHILIPERYQDIQDADEGSEDNTSEEEPTRPPSARAHIHALHATNRMIYLSATMDEPTDGSLWYEYKVRQAITDGYLCDYQFVFPLFARECKAHAPLAYYLVYRQQEHHCLLFASSREEGKAFMKELNMQKPGCAGYLDGDTTTAERATIFKAFEEGTLRFLVNIRVLVEGYDAPHIRSVFFLHISSSDLFTIQAIGRALRLHQDKIKATIYVPFTQEEDMDRIQAFLRHLATYDERIKRSMAEKREGGYLRVERGEMNDTEAEAKEMIEFRYNLVVDRMGGSIQWEEIAHKKALAYKAFVEEHGRHPKALRDRSTPQNNVEYCHARYLQMMKKAYYGTTTCKRYPAVERVFSDLLGENWHTSIDRHQLCIQRAREYVKWTEEHGERPRDRTRTLSEKKEVHELDDPLEYTVTVWYQKARLRDTLPIEVEQVMKQLGDNWRVNDNKERDSLIRAREFIAWYKKNGKFPCVIQSRDKHKEHTAERKQEHQLGYWWALIRMKKRNTGKSSLVLYPSIDTYLHQELGSDWFR